MTIDEFLDKYPAIKEKVHKDPVIKKVVDNHVEEYSKWGIIENELLYKLFLSVDSVRENLDKMLKNYLNNMSYADLSKNTKMNGSK